MRYIDFDNVNQLKKGNQYMKEYIVKFKNKIKRVYGKFSHFNINVWDKNETISYVLKNHSSVLRFGDGEFNIINGENIVYQNYDGMLAKRLHSLILRESNEKLVVCLPDVFHKMNRYNKNAQNFYNQSFFWKNRKILKEIEKKHNWYGSTFISRPYIDLQKKKGIDLYFSKLKKMWDSKDLLIVEGKFSRSGEGNDLFENANSIQRIICPPKNAFSKIKNIEEAIVTFSTNRLVLLMLGPTAKIIVDDLKYKNIQMIDLGHIDSEYEWYKMGAKSKIPVPNKHTAEIKCTEEIKLKSDKKFDNQIIKIIQ